MAEHFILGIWACWSTHMHLSCRHAAHQMSHAPRTGSSEVCCRGRQGAVLHSCCLQGIIQQASGIDSLAQLSAFLGNTRVDVQLVRPESLLQHSLLRFCTLASSCHCCLSLAGISFSSTHLCTGSCRCMRASLCGLVSFSGAAAQVSRLLRTGLLAALQIPCFLVVALSLLALLMYNRAQHRTLLLDFALYKAPEECRATWERYYQGLEDYKVRQAAHVAALWLACMAEP